MPVSSLPSEYGIGSFGKEAFAFVDFLAETGQTCWQVLPLNPTAYGDSPYQSPASRAGSPYYIDIDLLTADGLLTEEEKDEAKFSGKRVDYGHLFVHRDPLLRKAFSRFQKDSAYEAFCEEQGGWLSDYALFMALKVHYQYRPWTEWKAEHKEIACARTHAAEFAGEMDFWRWVQYTFRTQWQRLHEYAQSRGVLIIGDMPIYAAHDSVDVWRAREQFLLDANGNPTVVAGFPPDGFSPDGQLWGNPIYDWKQMKRDGFAWWIDRIGAAFELYDILRIDHFIGFENFYAVPYPSKTARNGKWNKAPGKALFAAVKKALPRLKIIAEDLGVVTEDVRKLLTFTGFPGMKMLHFAFYEEDSENLPRMYTSDNWVVYTASHDSDCTYTWGQSLNAEAMERFCRECLVEEGQSIPWVLIELAMGSRANLAMVPMQDYLELSNEEGRMNVPSVAHGNWSWRLDADYATDELKKKIIRVTHKNGRYAEKSKEANV
ncbi:MAG: 4-alpha-glucanotransferase [Ruminococcaceae bacterium]|nr:4-alpha-glucanotransferase [Oscillospiraceae bacterium]